MCQSCWLLLAVVNFKEERKHHVIINPSNSSLSSRNVVVIFFFPYLILLAFAEIIVVTLVCCFCTYFCKKGNNLGNSNRGFTFEQAFQHSILRSKIGAIVLCITRMICFNYFLIADVIVIINLGVVHSTLPQYFTSWNCVLLAF